MYRGEPQVEYFRVDWVDEKLKRDKNAFMSNYNNDVSLVLSHLIGQTGASSHGNSVWMSIDDPLAFQIMNPKSSVRDINANPVKAGFIFGKGGECFYLAAICSFI